MAGILPDVFWGLTWNDYDSLLFNHYYRQQQALAGHRAVALQVYNAVGSFSKNFRALKEAEFWPLALVDPAPIPVDKAAEAAWWARMEELATKSGKHFPAAQA